MSTGAIPRLVIAAPSSGAGKTTVATGLMAAFAEAGLVVSPHKVGPDYIDPGYHSLATGRPGRNLDAYLCGPGRIAPLFLHGAAGADLALVEGVMGLFDGASGMGELSSTAQVAKLLRAPVVLVVDASSQSRSVAALVHGFASWDPEVRLAGVILNKVGSDRHEELLREAMDSSGVPVLGALRRDGRAGTPSRHLGLVPVAERRTEAVESVAELAARVREGCDLAALLALARTVPELPDAPWDPAAELAPATGTDTSGTADSGRPLIAVAGGAAFTFSYAEHAELLAAAGADVAPFDPLRDERLPPGTQGLVIGGGFPEMYAPDLSANAPLRAAVAALAASGAPVSAECAGLLYLSRSLDGKPMCGVLPAESRMTARLTLGYREAVALRDNALAAAGTRVRGHEFHRTVLEPGAGADPAWGLTHPERRVEGFVSGGVHASYLHVHWAAEPSLAGRLVAGAAAAARDGGARSAAR
ncbi:cobyrinate a,c-diamide synthase [Streptomyces angustmyceticus]|uniref:cobyrinate a,c-diamide synthase n=1 Tax=Streptomyces angustmyceticus TaxID=285578 RepID=UPI00380741FA